jgi:hypothetical protein
MSAAIASICRTTGREWFCLFERVSLAEALHLIESDGHFAPC